MPLISQAAILLIVGAVVSANHANIFTAATALVIPVVMLHNLCGYALGFGFSKILGLEEPQQKAISFEVGMQDSSLGATLAMKYFVPQAAIPSTIFSIWHNISGSILSSWWKNHSKIVIKINEKLTLGWLLFFNKESFSRLSLGDDGRQRTSRKFHT